MMVRRATPNCRGERLGLRFSQETPRYDSETGLRQFGEALERQIDEGKPGQTLGHKNMPGETAIRVFRLA